MPRVSRIARTAVLAVILAALAAAPASAASWRTVSGLIPGTATDASIDGPRVLVTSLTNGRRVELSTIANDRLARRQTLTTAGRAGTVRYLQVARLRGGRALVVWQEPGAVRASLRPSAGARFSPAVTVSRHPGAATGAAIGPVLTVTPSGEAVVAWLGGPAGGRLGIQVATLAPGASMWSRPVEVSDDGFVQFGGPGVSAPLPVAATADPAGGVAVAWGQLPAVTPSRPALDVMAAVRTPGGAWSAPVRLGTGGFGLTVAAPAPGDLVAAWADGACANAASLRGSAVETVQVACRAGSLAGNVGVVRTTSNEVVIAAEFVPQPNPTSSTVEVAARDTSGRWGPSRLAIARVGVVADPVQATGGRTAVPAAVARGTQFDRVRVAVIGADGTVLRRIAGPARPTPPRNTSVRILPLGPGARVAMLLTRAPTIASERASILMLG